MFHRIFFAANAVRFVSFQFTLHSDTMITLKVVYAAFEQVLNVKTGWADSSRRMWHFSEDANPIAADIIVFGIMRTHDIPSCKRK